MNRAHVSGKVIRISEFKMYTHEWELYNSAHTLQNNIHLDSDKVFISYSNDAREWKIFTNSSALMEIFFEIYCILIRSESCTFIQKTNCSTSVFRKPQMADSGLFRWGE